MAQLLFQHVGHLPGMGQGRQAGDILGGVAPPVHPSVSGQGVLGGQVLAAPTPGGGSGPPSSHGSVLTSGGRGGSLITSTQNSSRVTVGDVVNRYILPFSFGIFILFSICIS